MKKISTIFYTAVAGLMAPTTSVFAQNASLPSGSGDLFSNPIGFDSFPELISSIMQVVVRIGTVVVILAVIYSGFLFVTAQGSDEKINKAKSTFLWVVIGAIILLGAEVLASVIRNTAGAFGA